MARDQVSDDKENAALNPCGEPNESGRDWRARLAEPDGGLTSLAGACERRKRDDPASTPDSRQRALKIGPGGRIMLRPSIAESTPWRDNKGSRTVRARRAIGRISLGNIGGQGPQHLWRDPQDAQRLGGRGQLPRNDSKPTPDLDGDWDTSSAPI
jgi:hypothetical protein